jgi:hypothetical protein
MLIDVARPLVCMMMLLSVNLLPHLQWQEESRERRELLGTMIFEGMNKLSVVFDSGPS